MEYAFVYALCCPVHLLAVLPHPRGCTRMGQVFIIARVGWWNIVAVRMLHWGKSRSTLGTQKRETFELYFLHHKFIDGSFYFTYYTHPVV